MGMDVSTGGCWLENEWGWKCQQVDVGWRVSGDGRVNRWVLA